MKDEDDQRRMLGFKIYERVLISYLILSTENIFLGKRTVLELKCFLK